MIQKVNVTLIFVILLVACSQPSPQIQAPSATPELEPSATHLPTSTTAPTPTNTIAPSPTKQPSPTPEPIPEPVIYEGSGDTLLKITKPIEDDMCFMFVQGNASASLFGINAYDADGNFLKKMIVTEKSYSGTRMLDGSPAEQTFALDIKAIGPWQIQLIPVIPPYMARYIIDVPTTFSGNGDVVILTRGQSSTVAANYTGDQHFAIHAHGLKSGAVVFNEQGAYSGENTLPDQTFLLEIMSEGDWEIEIK